MSSNEAPTPTGIDPDRWIEDHGDHLFRYAMFRLRDREAAEDAVQETLLAAMQSQGQYQRRSSERTWLIAILRHKIVDHLRRSSRYLSLELESEADFESLCFEAEGKFKGHWRGAFAPAAEFRCDEIVEEKDFLATLDRCLRALPERMATVFILKEIDGLSCDEICQSLNLTKSNLWVLLHRARLQLRHSLEKHWLSTQADARVRSPGKVQRATATLSAAKGVVPQSEIISA